MIRLTPTSYIVLGFLDFLGEATPYEIKQLAARSVGNFWSVPHAQFYSEPERLAGAGYVTETREEGGRRRKRYALTDRGREALQAWLATPTDEAIELRDPGILQLFFGADPAQVARAQLPAHKAKLAEYDELAQREMGPGPRLALECGLDHERRFIAYWKRLAADSTDAP